MDKKPKRPRDVSQLAKMMVDIASGEDEKTLQPSKINAPSKKTGRRTHLEQKK